MEPGMSPAASEPLRILSLGSYIHSSDGGGIRGISSLLILERIMETIRDIHQLDHVPLPCEHFDLIGGTSTGGIIAIMLGRLRMSVDECIRAYKKVARQAFTPKRNAILPARSKGAFSAQALEEAIKQTVRDFCTDKECVARRSEGLPKGSCQHSNLPFRDQACTKTVVFAITKSNVDTGPTLFKTYDTSIAFNGCAIWEVARATSAATTFFKPIKVGRDEIEFIDAGFGYNNPCDKLIAEAKQAFPGRQRLRILSIGTGLGDVVEIKDTRMSILNALKQMATSSRKVAASLDEQFGDDDQYFRFNVERGLEDITLSDWEKASKISAHTSNYLSEKSRLIEKFVKSFTATAGEDNRPKVYYMIPFLANAEFTGRNTILLELQQKLFLQKSTSKVALYGLGGIGKSQVALQYAYWVKNHFQGHSVFWVPAFSEASFQQACTGIVKELAILKTSNSETDMEAVHRYLSSKQAGPWIFIVDNADDIDLVFGNPDTPGKLCKYFPANESGVLLLTTRFRRVAQSFTRARDVIEVPQMQMEEATAFFEKIVTDDLLEDREMTKSLLEELNFLPLAIQQAASYISSADISISRYLELMQGTDKDKSSLASWHFHDDTRYPQLQNAIAITWRITFEKIKSLDPIAAEILQFMSCIEPKAIPRSLLPLGESEAQVESAIGTLCGYSFVTKQKDKHILDIHVLVQLATRLWVQKEGNELQTIERATRTVDRIFPFSHDGDREIWRPYLPHALEILRKKDARDMDERYNLFWKIGLCFLTDGRPKKGVEFLEKAASWGELHHSGNDRWQEVWNDLAGAYQDEGQTKKGVELLERVVMVQASKFDEGDRRRVMSEHELADAYRANGQTKEEIQQLEKIVARNEDTLNEGHTNRLWSLSILASAYERDGQKMRAMRLLEYVVQVSESTLDEKNFTRLKFENDLATSYGSNGQMEQAVKLLEHVVEVSASTRNEENSARLALEESLAELYYADRQIKRALNIMEGIVATRARTQGERHQSRLQSQHLLATLYGADGQTTRAVKLLQQILAIQEEEEGQPNKLQVAQLALAEAYEADGQIKRGVKLLEHALERQASISDEKHPARLQMQRSLARMKMACEEI
ncbi:hypothetical protein N7457_006270 [Penicillium paradoxum]|uniref:uncharacterized protein n=1 Tax=Penicillium paradoxum TaxID=176176 RepID=UPI002546887A|nr:uncharacterized protein N7457_006270 [Penicillium paradoxum]KAJ5781110.1 hypothetical protein N7457_006270 [Penicillium paradoxum]